MIKFTGHNIKSGKRILGIGITRQEIESLQGGKSILVKAEGIPFEVHLTAGETDEAISQELHSRPGFHWVESTSQGVN